MVLRKWESRSLPFFKALLPVTVVGFSYFNMCRNLWFRMCQKTFRFLNVSLAPAREWEEYVAQFVHVSFAPARECIAFGD